MVIPKKNGTQLKILEGSVLPRPLQRTAPRDVVLNGGGWFLAAFAFVFALAGIAGGPLLALKLERETARAEQARTSGVEVDAVVTEARLSRGQDPRLTVFYRYSTVDGQEFTSQARLRSRKRNTPIPRTGDKLRVVYLPSDPGQSWLRGLGPQVKPLWLALAPPLIGLPLAAVLFLVLQRQKRLLAEGRAAVAKVVAVEKQPGAEKTWKVTYAWRLLSGVERQVKVATAGAPTALGASVGLVYDPDRPERHALYPLALVRLR